jgi:hypothetical protein
MRRVAYGITLFAAAALFGCAGGSSGPTPMTNGAPAALLPRAPTMSPAQYAGLRALYVLDFATNVVDVLKNKSFREIGSISDGGTPEDVALDRLGNVYIANASPGKVDEFAPKATSPSFTYNAGMSSAGVVSTDAHGNVFEGDGNGFINEYYQGVNTVLYTCTLPSFPGGIAVDTSDDVFVSIPLDNEVIEYAGGLRGCSPTTLGVSLPNNNGIAVDRSGDLVVCAPGGGSVDVIDPPYTSVTRTIGSGWIAPWTVSLSRDEKYAYVTDINKARALVEVVNYATGANITSIGGGNGLVEPLAAVDGPTSVH